MGHSRPLFHLFSSFRTVQLLKNLAASGIRTQIFGAVGENTDHYTTTTALLQKNIIQRTNQDIYLPGKVLPSTLAFTSDGAG